MTKRGNLAIVLGITDNWAYSAGTVLLGLQKYKPLTEFDIIIYHQNLSEKNKKLLNKIHQCIFLPYESKLINPDKFLRVSELSFARYKCFGLLAQYKKVLWLDSDILIKGSIDGLINSCDKGIAMMKHTKIPISVSFSASVPGFDMEKECFNPGVMLLHSDLTNYKTLEKWCWKKTDEWSAHINSDQAIINLLLQEYNLSVTELDEKYNCYPDGETQNTLIIHPWGEAKFWSGYDHPLWNTYLSQWKKLGGEGPSLSFGRKLQAVIKRFRYIVRL